MRLILFVIFFACLADVLMIVLADYEVTITALNFVYLLSGSFFTL